jgi:hypothetical protein
MGTPVPISLGLRSNPYRNNKQVGAARITNGFAEEIGPEGKSQWVITGTPGLANFGSALSGGGIRCIIAVDDFSLVVAGRNLYRVNQYAHSTRTLIGGIPTDGQVYARRNRRNPVQVGFVSDGYFAVYDSGTLTEVTDADLPPPTSLAYLDGYGILPISRGRYMITGIDDFTTVDGLDEGSAESHPDEIVRAYELEREVYFFGTQSIEAHQNTGNADFPIERSQTMEVGCAAAGSVVPVDTPTGKALLFVAHDHSVRLVRGYQTQIISTGEIEGLIEALALAGNLGQLRATSWSWGGRQFACLSCDSWSKGFDVKTSTWHDRKSYLSDRWRVSEVAPFAGQLIAGDATTGQLYTMDDSNYSEAGNPHILEIITPPVHAEPYATRHNALYLTVARGVGLNTTTAADLDPVMMVDWSHDGGKTWSSPREVALGRLGKDARRLAPIRRLGRAGPMGRVYRFRISAAVEKIVMSAALDYDVLAQAA